MRVLFDLNILLDAHLKRAPHHEDASALLERVERGEVVGIVGATTVVGLRHLLERAQGQDFANSTVEKLLRTFEVRSIGRAALEEGLYAAVGDYEDAVLAAAARHGRADAIVTRNPAHFDSQALPAYTPAELLAQLRDVDLAA